MLDPVVGGWTVEEFLGWEDGTDTRYELIDGAVVAMAPPARAHGRLAARLGGLIDAELRMRAPCFVQNEAGIIRPGSDDTCYIADLAVSCESSEPGDRLMREPLLIIEILSPSTTAFDRLQKIADYRQIPSVQEILLIDSESMFAEILRRDAGRWITEIVRGPTATLLLGSVPLSVAMAEGYEGIPLPEPRARPAATL